MEKDIRFLLNLQILADELIEDYPEMQFYRGEDSQVLEGVCFYRKNREMVSWYAYILGGEELREMEVPKEHCSLLVLGEIPESWKKSTHSLLQLSEKTDLLELMNLCQEAFHKHESWQKKCRIASSGKGVWRSCARSAVLILIIRFLSMIPSFR